MTEKLSGFQPASYANGWKLLAQHGIELAIAEAHLPLREAAIHPGMREAIAEVKYFTKLSQAVTAYKQNRHVGEYLRQTTEKSLMPHKSLPLTAAPTCKPRSPRMCSRPSPTSICRQGSYNRLPGIR